NITSLSNQQIVQIVLRLRLSGERTRTTQCRNAIYIHTYIHTYNSVRNSRSYPGADANSDHNLVMAKLQLKLKKITKRKKVRRWCLKDLGSKKKLFQEELRKEMASVGDLGKEDIEEHWLKLRETIS